MKQRRRVALVIGQLTRGGGEGQLAQVARHLDRERFEPVVYCLSAASEPVGSEIRAVGATVRIVTGSDSDRARQLARALRDERIDLVHAWLYPANAIAGAAHLLAPSRPLITSARNRKLQGTANQLANVLAFRLSRAIVVNSTDVAAYIRQHYWAPRRRIRIIANGIDTERFHPDNRAGDIRGPIVTVGRLVEQKNHDLFLRAAAALSRDFAGLQFVIVGDGPLRAALEARVQQLGLGQQVSLAGERADVEVLMRSASLFWLTSRWEGMPNVVLESLASGVPVIATDVGGTHELIRTEIDGFVVPNEDQDALVRHSAALLRDAELRQRFAVAARARAAEFSTTRMVDAMAHLYDEVLR